MAKPAYTTFAEGGLWLDIGNRRYEVVQFTSTFATNTIPQAQCLLATGRDMRADRYDQRAQIHKKGSWPQMERAQVYMKPSGDSDIEGGKWPEAAVMLFDGFLLNISPSRTTGRAAASAVLIHWSYGLACSSAISSLTHPAFPSDLSTSAIIAAGAGQLGGEGGSRPANVSGWAGAGFGMFAPEVRTDFWSAIKTFFSFLAQSGVVPAVLSPGGICGGTATPQPNTLALEALSKIEGPTTAATTMPYKYGVPLSFQIGPAAAMAEGISRAIGNEMVSAYGATSLWDKLVRQICPQFGLAIVPMIDRMLIVADTPTLNAVPWIDLYSTDYDGQHRSNPLDRPLRGVVVSRPFIAEAFSEGNGSRTAFGTAHGACYLDDSVEDGDGYLQHIEGPSWISLVDEAARSSASAVVLDGAAEALPPSADVAALYSAYAKDVFTKMVHRGATSSVTGRLRLDIAPGSLVNVLAQPDPLARGAADDMAIDITACVTKVTVTISAEPAVASTSYELAYVRVPSDFESNKARSGVTGHPLFGSNIHGGGRHGAPLLTGAELW